jgi:hypothetical protein
MKLQASCILNNGYINLPLSILEKYKDKEFPLYFKLTGNTGMNIIIGVKDFSAKEDIVEIPKWLAIYLAVHEMEFIDVELSKQPLLINFVKLEPQEEELFNIPDYDKHLEKELSHFSTLKIDSIFNIFINNKEYHFKVLELEPDWFLIGNDKYINDIDCLSLINVDLNVDIYNKFFKKKSEEKLIEKLENKVEIPEKINLKDLREKRLNYFSKNIKNS